MYTAAVGIRVISASDIGHFWFEVPKMLKNMHCFTTFTGRSGLEYLGSSRVPDPSQNLPEKANPNPTPNTNTNPNPSPNLNRNPKYATPKMPGPAARRWSNICHSLSWPKLISVLLVIFSAENHCRPNKWLLHFASSGNRYVSVCSQSTLCVHYSQE